MSVTPSHPIRHVTHKPGVLFLRGPVPILWLAAARKAGGTALAVGILLWHLGGMKDAPEELVVTRKRAEDVMGLGRDALSRGLKRLEDVNLITTARGRGKAIRVTILPASLAGADRSPLPVAGMPLEGQ